MSTKYPGGFITKSPVAPTTTAASGVWTLDQQQQYQKAGTWPSPPLFIEDLFSTYLVTGDGTAPAVNNGIDVSGQGGLVWIKKRSAAGSHSLFDTARGANLRLISNDTAAQDSVNLSFTSTGFSNYTFDSAVTYASWTFRKQPKFFDVVTYTGTGVARTIAHNLGSVPGCIIIKRTDAGGTLWYVYHRANTSGGSAQSQELRLNNTNATNTNTDVWNNTAPTSTVFSIGAGASPYDWNASGGSYVAYLFAHDAGGFPASGGGSTNGISCGSFTTDASGNFSVNLGYEPQWVMIKSTNNTGVSAAQQNWIMMDSMRGLVTQSGNGARLRANTSEAESTTNDFGPTATGFESLGNMSASAPFIYIAIRRGPMKVPTSGTSVFNIVSRTGTGAAATVTGVGFPVDLVFAKNQSQTTFYWDWLDRLRGPDRNLFSNATDAEYSNATVAYQSLTSFANMDGVVLGADGWNAYINGASNPYTNYFWRRAPGFFDEVCYTGTEVSGQTFNHNLGVVPEMMIVKARDGTTDWTAYHSALGASARIYPNSTNAANTGTAAPWNSTAPTSTVFSLGNAGATNLSGTKFVNYLFATCAGVSKVGSYTGTGALQTINCGFTSGARFVLIKRTDSTGDWYVYDSARGITSGNDPYLFLNSTAAEVTGTNYVDTDTTGFQVTAAAPAGLNANGGTYIFLAIA